MTTTSSTRNSTALRTPKRLTKRVVLAGRFALAAKLTEQLRQLGWEVHTVPTGHDVHTTAAATDPHAVLLPEAGSDESGYLACAKLRRTQPDLKVVVVGSERTPRREALALFVGAGFVTETDGV
ncbi:MAG TPA: response regulator, partial [Gemmata sp.]